LKLQEEADRKAAEKEEEARRIQEEKERKRKEYESGPTVDLDVHKTHDEVRMASTTTTPNSHPFTYTHKFCAAKVSKRYQNNRFQISLGFAKLVKCDQSCSSVALSVKAEAKQRDAWCNESVVVLFLTGEKYFLLLSIDSR